MEGDVDFNSGPWTITVPLPGLEALAGVNRVERLDRWVKWCYISIQAYPIWSTHQKMRRPAQVSIINPMSCEWSTTYPLTCLEMSTIPLLRGLLLLLSFFLRARSEMRLLFVKLNTTGGGKAFIKLFINVA